MNDPSVIRRLYGRRQGHKLRQGQAALVEELLPRLSVPDTGPLDAHILFGDAEGQGRPLQLEIGFGAGEHLAGQAAANPDTGFIGCEPFLNGVVGALGHVRDGDLANVPCTWAMRWRWWNGCPTRRCRASTCSTPIPGPRRAMPNAGW